MGVARSALFYLCDRFESVSENTPCAKRRGVAGGSRSEPRELWGFHGCGRLFNRVGKANSGHIRPGKREMKSSVFLSSFFSAFRHYYEIWPLHFLLLPITFCVPADLIHFGGVWLFIRAMKQAPTVGNWKGARYISTLLLWEICYLVQQIGIYLTVW